MSFEGTIGIYQGEELGQTETELTFDELTDPPALRYWPAVKGRDGCRTPMVWEADAPNAGFSNGKPWLPVKPPQAARAVDQQANDDVLPFYRDMIAFRKASPALTHGKSTFFDLPEPIFAFTREAKGQTLTCVFNLSKATHELNVEGQAVLTGPQNATLSKARLTLPGNGFAFLLHDGPLAVSFK